MRLGLLGLAALVVGGCAMTPRNPDVEKVVSKPPAVVYDAVAAMVVEGEQTVPMASVGGSAVVRITKGTGRSIHFEMLVRGERLGVVDLGFSEGATSSATVISGEIEVDKALLGRIAGETGAGPIIVTDAMINKVFASALDGMVKNIEQGRPLGRVADISTFQHRRPAAAANYKQGVVGGSFSRAAEGVPSAAWPGREAAHFGQKMPQASAAPMLDPHAPPPEPTSHSELSKWE